MRYVGKFFGLPVFESDEVEDFEFRKGGITKRRVSELEEEIQQQRIDIPGNVQFMGFLTLRELEMLLAVTKKTLFEESD
jgi:hypothetical protein